MREIKFRTFHKPSKSMDYSDQYDESGNWAEQLAEFFSVNAGSTIKDHEGMVYMQYTGLKDKNGKEIWEGDLVKWKHPYALPGDGKQGEWYYGQVAIEDGITSYSGTPCNAFMKEGTLEVIGNVYENPELIKAGPED